MRMDSLIRLLMATIMGSISCLSAGCATWPMLPQRSVTDPIGALGGSGMVYAPTTELGPVTADRLATLSPAQLAEYYAPLIVQQRQVPGQDHFQWSPNDDSIGSPFLVVSNEGKLKTHIDTRSPTVYVHHERRLLGDREHLQITYTVWYPRHPKTKTVDIESADIDSGIMRITLDDKNSPILYETVLACGCYHKVFVEQWVEAAARLHFGGPERDKRFSVERRTPFAFDWEVAGTVQSPANAPVRPAIFVSAGEHKVQGLHSSAGFQWPPETQVAHYRLAPYEELLSALVTGSDESEPNVNGASIFNSGNDQQVWGADRMEKYIFMFIGTDDAGHPRRDDEILLHFDQSHWKDPDNYQKHLRLPPGIL